MDEGTNSTSTNSMDILDGVFSSFGVTDILQQAIDEATSCETSVSRASATQTQDVIDISGLLQSSSTSGNCTRNQTVQLFDQASTNSRIGKLPSDVKVIAATLGQQQKLNDVMTVYNGATLSLSLETARSLGIEVTSAQCPKVTTPLIQQESNATVSSSVGQSVIVNSGSLLRSSVSNGPVTYILQSAPSGSLSSASVLRPLTTQLPVIQHSIGKLRPAVNIVRPTVVGNGIAVHMNNTGVLTSVLRPVMTTGIANSGQAKRHQPLILPKIAPTPNQAKAPLTSSLKVMKQNGSPNQPINFMITSAANQILVHNSSSPLGTSTNPIQLIQEGSTLRSPHPLTNTQVTQIAKALKERNQNEVPSAVVCDNGPNSTRIVYKIVYPEDVAPPKRTALSGDTSDEDSYGECESPPQIPIEQVFTPEEILRMPTTQPPSKTLMLRGRKRGRPRSEEAILSALKSTEDHAKKLRSEFGLTGAQASKLEKDIVDDRIVKLTSRPPEHDEDESVDKIFSVSRTRSGRMSRPPTQLEDSEYVRPVVTQPSLPPASGSGEVIKPKEEEIQVLQRPKRKLSVPPRYRCRVCHKTYLGDKKMNRHMKLFPTHGPCEEPPMTATALKDESSKKISALTSMPIIPLARTQLEELVKNLDAELVLDVVSKKMFDNFSMWQLQLKKMSMSKEKGIKVVDKLFQDTENVLIELKKLVDNCLTDTKLCDDPCPSVTMGEYLQLALTGHDSPWYLEKVNHIPEEYHKPLGLEPLIVSPRSESNELTLLHDENSNSMMSGASEPRQMILKMEKNLGARSRLDDIDDDSQDYESPSKKTDYQDQKCDESLSPAPHSEVVVQRDEQKHGETATKTEGVSPDLAMEIDTLNNLPLDSDKAESESYPRTRLPSFSSIINSTTTTNVDNSSLLSVLQVTTCSDLGSHHLNLHNQPPRSPHTHPVGDEGVENDAASVHSRRSSIDTSGLVIHESLPGSRHTSPAISRRGSIDLGGTIRSNLDHLRNVTQTERSVTCDAASSVMSITTDVTSGDFNVPELNITSGLESSGGFAGNVTQTALSVTSDATSITSGLSLSTDVTLTDISSHLPFISHHDEACRMPDSAPPTPATGLQINIDPSRHYRMPSSPRTLTPSGSVGGGLPSMTSYGGKTSEDDLLLAKSSVMEQLTIHAADMDTRTNVTFTDNHPIVSLSPEKTAPPNLPTLPEIEKRPDVPPASVSCTIPLPPPSGVSQDSSSSVSQFFGDLESVLADSTDFIFNNSSMKTPEKCFYAVSPKATMSTKKSNAGHLSTCTASSAPVRIDFLGAIEKNDQSDSASALPAKSDNDLNFVETTTTSEDQSQFEISSLFFDREHPEMNPNHEKM